jgi:hypothetical protein
MPCGWLTLVCSPLTCHLDSHGPLSSETARELVGIEADFDDVVEEREDGRQRKRRHEQRHEPELKVGSTIRRTRQKTNVTNS